MKHAIVALLLSLMSAPTWAHNGDHHGIWSGLMHPLTGVDHLFALSLIGLLAARQLTLSRTLLLGLGSFLIAAMIGQLGWLPPMFEATLALSLIILAALAARVLKLNSYALLPLLAGLAAMHGLAHGAESPGGAATTQFFVGFLLSSTALLSLGHLAGRGIERGMLSNLLLKLSSAASAGTGLALLLTNG